MYKQYEVRFLNNENGMIKTDCFMGRDKREARMAFRECYRYGDYKIISTEEKNYSPLIASETSFDAWTQDLLRYAE